MIDDSSEEEFIPEYVPRYNWTQERRSELREWLVEELGVDQSFLDWL